VVRRDILAGEKAHCLDYVLVPGLCAGDGCVLVGFVNYVYFVSFRDTNSSGFGRCHVKRGEVIESIEDVASMEQEIKADCGREVLIMNFQLMSESPQEKG